MGLKSYEEMSSLHIDVMREIGSIGTGNAVTALSTIMDSPISMEVPDIGIEGFNEAVEALGNPEDRVAGVLVRMSGDMEGIVMVMIELNTVNELFSNLIGKKMESFDELDDMGISALTEVANIMISSYVNALSTLAGMDINLQVPVISVDMRGGMMNVPMAQLGYETDKLLMIKGNLSVDGKEYQNNILMFPYLDSLNRLMDKLVNVDD